MIRVVGIDGGLAHLGVAVVDFGNRDGLMRLTPLSLHLFRSTPTKDGASRSLDLGRRLRALADFVGPLVAGAGVVCLEALSLGIRSSSAAYKVGTAFGAVVACNALGPRAVFVHISPQNARKTLLGVKKAEKADVHGELFARWPALEDLVETVKPKGQREHPLDAFGVVAACFETGDLARAIASRGRGAAA